MGVALALKLPILLFLTPVIGPLAAPLGSFLFYIVAALIDLYFIFRKTALTLPFGRTLLTPLLSALLSSLLGYAAYRLTVPYIGVFSLLPAGLAAFLLYALLCLLLGCVSAEDLRLLPMGERIVGLLKRTSLIK